MISIGANTSGRRSETLRTVDNAAIKRAQRAALAGTLRGNQLLELQRMKLAPSIIVQRLANVRRRYANRLRAMETAETAAKRLPALRKRLETARQDLTLRPGDVAGIESDARACARMAAGVADAETLEAARIEVATIDAYLEGIDSGDGDTLVEATRYLAQYEKP